MDEELFSRTSCIILSAGNSDRMGKPKALLEYGDGSTFIEKITQTYVQAGINQIIVVVNAALYNTLQNRNISLSKKVELVVNLFPDKGRFFSLQTGAQKVLVGNSLFFQNIDNPFTDFETLKLIHNNKGKADVIIPTFETRAGHPVLLNADIVAEIASHPDTEMRIDEFLYRFKRLRINIPDKKILANINTTDDYTEAGFDGLKT